MPLLPVAVRLLVGKRLEQEAFPISGTTAYGHFWQSIWAVLQPGNLLTLCLLAGVLSVPSLTGPARHKDRQFNRRFLQMFGHYLVEPTTCSPASGWEKGQVENQVGMVRERFFTPRLRVASYE
jgi:hypothetical protein